MAGLVAAFRLRRHGLGVTVFEQADVPGGAVRTEQAEGFLVEHGPNSLRARTPELHDLIVRLGLGSEVVEADAAARRRYVVRGGRPVALPASPPGLLASAFLSWPGKLRLLAEPFVPRGAADAGESVAAFVRRRLGAEALAYGADPFVAGIFAGDPERLSLRYAFPRLLALEQTHGSLLKGLVNAEKAAAGGGIFSFQEGLGRLPAALAEALGPALRLGMAVTGVRAEGGGFFVEAGGEATRFEGVVSTLPLGDFAALHAMPDLGVLRQVKHPPVAVVALGFRREDVAHPLDGFGLLVPSAETSFRILGTIFASTVFPGRAPAGRVLLTTLVGGSRRPHLARQPDDVREAAVLEDLQRLLGVRGAPVFRRQSLWPRAIPQYELGYGAVLARLEALEAAHPGLVFAGNYRQGISVPDTIASAEAAAERLATHLG